MAGSLIERAFGMIEALAQDSVGQKLTTLGEVLSMPKSAAHRLLVELIRLGYVRQNEETERYQLTTKLISVGFRHLSSSGLVDVAQPILDRLARECGELVRLAIVDGDGLTWVTKAQGATAALRYDPDMGANVRLFCTATGQAWLSSLEEAEATEIAARQGFGKLGDFGPNAPRTVSAFLDRLKAAREQGFAYVVDSAAVGTAAIAAVVRHPSRGHALGTVSLTGPSARLNEQRLLKLAPAVVGAAAELSATSPASQYLSEAGRINNKKQSS